MLVHSEVDVFCFLLVITLAPLLNFNTCKIRFRKWAWPHEQGIPIRNWFQEAGFGKGGLASGNNAQEMGLVLQNKVQEMGLAS